MPHFYVNPKDIKDKFFVIENEQFHYLSTVRRFSTGDEINIFDGLGNSYKARIDSIDRASMKGTILSSKTFVLPKTNISLYTAIPKGERFDWLIEKAGEIGISKIVPVIYLRSVVKELSENKIERYKKISISASSQSWRADIMPIDKPVKFNEVVKKVSKEKDTLNVLPWESEEDKNILGLLNENKDIKNINIFIGPEGGFDKSEIDVAVKNNFKTVTLGKNILRVETAAIVASSIVTSVYNV
ncbi:MAG: 16S rRNA (uracil(1498)-N(3))-methyltransferase [Elusimicrobia bacterium]|nr:16S rRNA (uracil(1498)-N(3))-methyltransferase [Elusimicrobiota bacterium]